MPFLDELNFRDQLEPPPATNFSRDIELVRVIDGDTLVVVIDQGWDTKLTEQIRLERVNTPEKTGVEARAGLYVAQVVTEQLLLTTQPLKLSSSKFDRSGRIRGRYGRTIGSIWSGHWCLNSWLLLSGLAWPTDDNGSLLTDRDLRLLTGIPSELR